jgi:hypothetical protein
MTKRQGSHNYNEAEKQHLLELVRSRAPSRKADWQAMADAYNATKDPRWAKRDFVSLKRKYRGLRQETAHQSTQGLTETAQDTEISAAIVSGVKGTSPNRPSEQPQQPLDTFIAQPTTCSLQHRASGSHPLTSTLLRLLVEDQHTRSGACTKHVLTTILQELHNLRQEHHSYRRTERRHHKDLRKSIATLQQTTGK